MDKKIEQLLELINDIVDDSSIPWTEKRDLIQKGCGEREETNLDEFVSWFEQTD